MLQHIKQPISEEFERFSKLFDDSFVSPQDQLLKQVMEHVHSQKGKQIRPIFTLLCAKLCGDINDNTLRIAAGYETLHTASLIHDDVVDNTMQRRNQPSANALFDNKVSVLAGDFLLSKAIRFIADTDCPDFFKILCRLSQTLAEGELLQLQHAFSVPSEDEYIEIIRRKTAILFTLSADSAVLSVHASEADRQAINDFSNYLGICFQIKDDIFDYTPNAQIGKPTLNDIREGKITLPLLHALQQVPANEANEVLEAARRNEFTDDYFFHIGSLVAKYHGIEYAQQRIEYYLDKARHALDIFPEGEVKSALLDLLTYTITRNK